VGEIHERKTSTDILEVFQKLRACYRSDVRLYIVMDNLSSHKTALLADFMTRNNMEPVFTPTYASWLNAIEPHFFGVKKFTCQVTDDRDHLTRRKRIRSYLIWRNRETGSDTAALAIFMVIQLERH